MSLKFVKMHGLGNDFMVLNGIQQPITLTKEQIIKLSHRQTGVGFDQCLTVEKSKQKNIDFFYRIINADGQEVGQCGNGARCLARFIHHYGLSSKKKITVATSTTEMILKNNPDETITVQMNPPSFSAEKVPTTASQINGSLQIPDVKLPSPLYGVNVGNPHAVMLVSDIEKAPVATLGQQLCQHPYFPEQANIGFMEIKTANHIRLRVYERGCGETKACGSGAVAAALIGQRYLNLHQRIKVDLPGGSLDIEWEGDKQPVFLTGTATFVYEGEICESYFDESSI